MSEAQILCIEDDPNIAELLVEVLSDEGFRVFDSDEWPRGSGEIERSA